MERDSNDESAESSPPRTEYSDSVEDEELREAFQERSLLAARAISMIGPSPKVFRIFGKRLGGLFTKRDIDLINVKPKLKFMLSSRVFWCNIFEHEAEMVYKLLKATTDEIDAAIAQQQEVRFEVTGERAPSVRWSSVTQSAKSRLTFRCEAYKKLAETHMVCLLRICII